MTITSLEVRNKDNGKYKKYIFEEEQNISVSTNKKNKEQKNETHRKYILVKKYNDNKND